MARAARCNRTSSRRYRGRSQPRSSDLDEFSRSRTRPPCFHPGFRVTDGSEVKGEDGVISGVIRVSAVKAHRISNLRSLSRFWERLDHRWFFKVSKRVLNNGRESECVASTMERPETYSALFSKSQHLLDRTPILDNVSAIHVLCCWQRIEDAFVGIPRPRVVKQPNLSSGQ